MDGMMVVNDDDDATVRKSRRIERADGGTETDDDE